MEYLVISDSHGRADLVDRAMKTQIHAPDAILFLGDGLRDLRVLEYQDLCVRCVRGNCDYFSSFEGLEAPELLLLELGAYRVLMMHGHTHGVKHGLTRACAYAAQAEADVLLFGHTHTAMQKWHDQGTVFDGTVLKKPLLVCNPGSLQNGCFGMLSVNNQGVLFGTGSL